jgi:type VI secretion system Hcp family effector
MLDNKTLESVVVRSLRSVNGTFVPYLEIKLYSVKVTSYSVNGSGLDNDLLPTETVSFVYEKITWTYVPTGATHQDTWERE